MQCTTQVYCIQYTRVFIVNPRPFVHSTTKMLYIIHPDLYYATLCNPYMLHTVQPRNVVHEISQPKHVTQCTTQVFCTLHSTNQTSHCTTQTYSMYILDMLYTLQPRYCVHFMYTLYSPGYNVPSQIAVYLICVHVHACGLQHLTYVPHQFKCPLG